MELPLVAYVNEEVQSETKFSRVKMPDSNTNCRNSIYFSRFFYYTLKVTFSIKY